MRAVLFVSYHTHGPYSSTERAPSRIDETEPSATGTAPSGRAEFVCSLRTFCQMRASLRTLDALAEKVGNSAPFAVMARVTQT
mmetsp:Transcript_15975/g.34270  ORF Transcript_15975/g.34270 Transcript_15975/m.34270 type:complete len:83 (-) Transcript_15975:499-747(-)